MTEIKHDQPFELAEAIPVLAATPAALSALLEDLPDAWLDFQEDPEAWSPRTVLVHFIHNERTNWIPRARVILAEGQDHRFPPFQQLPDMRQFENVPAGQLLGQFADLRKENLAALKSLNLKTDDYTRQGEHPVLGTVTLRQLLAAWVVHDLNHMDQIGKTLAKRYREAVGPWRRNLAILDR